MLVYYRAMVIVCCWFPVTVVVQFDGTWRVVATHRIAMNTTCAQLVEIKGVPNLSHPPPPPAPSPPLSKLIY